MKKLHRGWLNVGGSPNGRLRGCLVLASALALCAVTAEAAEGMSSASPAFLRWQKMQRLVRPAATNVQKKAARLLSAPEQSEQVEETGLIPSVFNAAYLGNINLSRVRGIESAYPAKYDLRAEGQVSPVRNQQPYGTCWAHATYASLESALIRSAGLSFDFSENNLVNMHGGDWGFDKGGNGDLSSAYLLRWSGPALESEDAYPNIGGSSARQPFRHVQSVRWVLPKKVYLDNDGIKDAVMTHGALYASYFHDAGYYNPSTASYYLNVVQKETDGSRVNNHAVAIVGWDDNYPRGNFKIKPPADGAYLVKNSMGSSWGKEGYFYVSYFDESFAWNRLYAFSNAEPVGNYDAIYQYDTLGLVNSYGWGDTTAWGACIFAATNDSPVAAVGFYALVPETDYTIQIYTGCRSGNPVSGVKALEQSGQTDGAGFVTVPLQTPVGLGRGQAFSVVLKLTTPGYGFPLACEYAISGYSSAATAAAGQTFVSRNGGEWLDFTKLNGTVSFCCKAYTRPSSSAGKTLTALVVDGPVSVRSGKSARFTCRARYSDGTVADVTGQARWNVIEGAEYAYVPSPGVVQAREVGGRQLVRLYAEYTDGGIMQNAVRPFYVTFAAPLAPGNLTATQGAETTCVRLCWDASEDVSSYAIYRSETDSAENAEYLGDSGATVYDDTKAVPGMEYRYFVKAKNSSGASPFSAGAMGWRALSAPENVVAGSTSLDYVEISWCESPGANYYCVYRADDVGDEPVLYGGWQSSLSFRDRDAVAGKTYLYYVVAAVDALGGKASGFSLFDDGRRAVPVYLKSIAIDGEASIASGDASTYRCRATYTDGSLKLIDQPSGGWTITVGGIHADVSPAGLVTTRQVDANQSVVLRVNHDEQYADGSWKRGKDFKHITIRALRPYAPFSVSIMGTSAEGISISWSVDTTSPPPLAYRIYRMAAGGEQILLTKVGKDTTTYTDRTATPGVTYTYRVSAENGAGEGPVSTIFATETMRLAAPATVVATDGAFLDKVTVSWKPVTGATHYKVYRGRSSSSAEAVELSGWQTGTQYEDFSAGAGVSYWYFVRAAAGDSGEVAGGFGAGDEGWRREIPVLDSITVSGAPRLASEGSTVFACMALYGDGTRQTVMPEWTVAGPASIDEAGRLVVDSVSAGSTVTVTARYREGGVERTATAEVRVVVPVKATAEVKNVAVTPRWPFNGMVDVDYEVATSPLGTLASVTLSGIDHDHGVALSAQSLAGDGAEGAVAPGKHRLVWNVAADHPCLHAREFGIEMSAVPVPVLIPTNVTASSGTSTEGVDLAWSQVDDALSYEIWRSQTSMTNDAVCIATTYDLLYSDTNAVAGTQFFYWIRSVGTEGLGGFGDSVRGLRAYADISVVFDANGGETAVWEQEYTPLETYGSLPFATRTGYDFEGWFTAKDGGDRIGVKSSVPTSPTILYAHWRANIYAIHFNANSGTGSMVPLSMTYDVQDTLPPCGFVRAGYTFAGWAMSAGGSVVYPDKVSVTNLTAENEVTVSLFAVWTPIVPAAPTNVSATKPSNYMATDGISIAWKVVADATGYRIYRAEIDMSSQAEEVGSVFGATTAWLDEECEVGKDYYYWVTAYRSDNGQESGFSNVAQGRRRYEDIVCTFNGNGGTATSSSKNYTPELKYPDLPSADRLGYTFEGWYTKPVGGVKVTNSSYVPTEPLTLYAHWTPIKYFVHFEKNGGSGNMTDLEMTYDLEVNLPSNTFSRAAYTFDGWATSADGDKVYDNQARVKNLSAENGAIVKLHARWIPIPPATVANVQAAVRESAEGILVSWSEVEKATKYFVYRDTDANSSNPQLIGETEGAETSYLDSSDSCIAGTAYYYWVKAYRDDNKTESVAFSAPSAAGYRRYPDVTVSFNGNGGTAGSSSQSFTPEFPYGALPSATRTGYTFAGWWTAASGGTQVTKDAIVHTSNVTLWAHWTANTYAVTLNRQGGSGGTDSVTATYAGAMPSITLPTRTGYTFGGYYTEADGAGTQYYKADGASARKWDKTEATTLYAKWTANTYTVTFNLQGGGGGTSNVPATFGSAMPSITAPTRTGYSFGGYYAEADGGGTQYYTATGASARAWDKTSAATLYAKWTANTYTVTLDQQDGSGGTGSVTATVASAMPQITVPTRSGFTFGGYYSEANGAGTQYYTPTGASAHRWDKAEVATLYAKWNMSFASALDNAVLDFSIFEGGWIGMEDASTADGDSAKSVFPGFGKSSTLDAHVTGTGIFSFKWKVQGGTDVDLLAYRVDTDRKALTEGLTGGTGGNWMQETYTVTDAGIHLVRWVYHPSAASGINPDTDCAWIDDVRWSPYFTFDGNGGSPATADIAYLAGKEFGTMPNVSRTGYTMKGWYTAPGGGTWVVSTTTVPASNQTFYAKWEANKYTVTFNLQGGGGGTSNVPVTFGSAMPQITPPTRPGYTFGGYYTAANGGGTQYYNASGKSAHVWDKTAATTLFAKWTENVPPAPTGVIASNGESTEGVALSWNETQWTLNYKVLRGTSGDASQVDVLATTNETSYIDTEATPGVEYTYWIVAVNNAGDSAKSASAIGVRKLTAPTGLAAAANGNIRIISWSPVSGATGYNVYRAESDDSSTATLVASVNTATYQEVPEKAGKNYYFWIQAVGASGSGNSDLSVSQMCYRPLGAPTITSAVTASFGTQISFTRATDASKHRLYWAGTLQAETTSSSFTVKYITGGSYWIEICGVGENGIEGPHVGKMTTYSQW